ncbi:glycosyltransferase family 4 protein [Variovorax defluvii]|uniref:Glycosyltransferase family 4 protein n=1 Tax=Variovorax defluvii TaxID=913761 RepID=A0ABP8IHD7_9BURK
MKQVWILNHYAQEPGGPGGTRHYHLSEHLEPCGWQASVIAASVELNTGRQRLAAHEATRHERIGNVPFLWVRTPAYRGNGGGRMLNMLAFAWRAIFPRTTRGLPRPNAVIGSSVHPFAAVAGACLARRFDVPFVFEVRDLWPQTLIDLGRLKEGAFLTWVFRQLEAWLYRRAARIVVLLPRAWEYIVPLGIPKDRIVWIPNGVDLALFPRSPHPLRAPSEPFTLMYFGAHGQANGLDNVLQAMKVVQDQQGCRRLVLRMIGDGPLKPALMLRARELGLNNIRFEPPVPKSRIPMLAAQADAFVFSLTDAPVFRYGISSNKLFDFMASERPVVFSCDAANNPVRDAGAGFTVEVGDAAGLAQSILEMAAASPEKRRQMGAAGREYVEQNHGFAQLSERLARVLDEACAQHARWCEAA